MNSEGTASYRVSLVSTARIWLAAQSNEQNWRHQVYYAKVGCFFKEREREMNHKVNEIGLLDFEIEISYFSASRHRQSRNLVIVS